MNINVLQYTNNKMKCKKMALNAAEKPGFWKEWAPAALNAAEKGGFWQEWEPQHRKHRERRLRHSR